MKKLIKRLTKPKRKKDVVEKELDDKNIDDLAKELALERGAKEGEITALEEQNQALQEELSPSIEKAEIAKFLKKQELQLQYKHFDGALSLKKLFRFISKGDKIRLLSYNTKKNFGLFDDIVFRSDGRIAIFCKKDGVSKPLSVGSNLKHLFWDYSGLSNSASLKLFTLSMDENGSFVDNFMAKEIPQVIIDKNGKQNLSKINTKPFMQQLIDNQGEINELQGYIEELEEVLSKESGNANLEKVHNQINKERAETSETNLVAELKNTTEIVKHFREFGTEMAVKSQMEHINNQKIDNLEEVKNTIMDKLRKIESSPDMANAEDKLRETANFVIDVLTANASFAKTPEEEA